MAEAVPFLISGMVEQAAEKVSFGTTGAKALTEKETFIAALKTLRHPKSEFFSKLFVVA